MITRSAALLDKIISSGDIQAHEVASELQISAAEVEFYATSQAVMSLSQQKSLALFVINKSPRFAALGHKLVRQVEAATAYAAGDTKVHARPPLGWSGTRRK